jgi:tetratricopeptide (TPR) repeat protein
MTTNKSGWIVVALVAVVALAAGGCATGPEQTTAPKRSQAVETYARGVYAYQSGKKDQAVDSLKQALEANPQLIMPRVILGRIYKERGDYANAKEYYEALVAMDPYEVQNHYNLGLSYQMLQRLQDAAKSYSSALKLRPDDFGSNMNLGLVYLALGDTDKAVKYTDKAAQIRPDSPEAQANLALALDGRGDYALAERAYRKSIQLAPRQVGTLINYANNLLAQQKPRDAQDVLQQTLKLEDTPYLRKRLGDAYALEQRYDDALQQYREALKRNPKYFSAVSEQGRVLLMQYQSGMELDEKKRDEALGLLRQSLEMNPRQPKIKAVLEEWDKRMFSK